MFTLLMVSEETPGPAYSQKEITEITGKNELKIVKPEDIKKPSREKWLKGVAYTLTDEPDNIGQYVTRPRIDQPVKSGVPV